MHLRRPVFLIFLGFLLSSLHAGAQVSQEPDSLGPFCLNNIDRWKIHSGIIGENYTLYVLRTEAYDTTEVRLPVLYMTDGDWNMTVAMNCFSMLRQDYKTREPLIVGIGYGKEKNQRFRDLDPATGGPAFLEFIEKEVMPFIEKKYRTTDEKAIYGYSMGGMFTTYILFNRPDLFDLVFIGAPGYAGRQLMPAAKAYFKDHTNLKSKVFIGVGSFEKTTVQNINAFVNYLDSLKCPDLTISKEFTPGANHGAALSQVMENAISFGYCEHRKPIKADPVNYKGFSGKYKSKDATLPDILVYTDKNKLFGKINVEGELPSEFLPQSKTEFFIAEDERTLFSFRKENNNTILVVIPADNKEYYFIREK